MDRWQRSRSPAGQLPALAAGSSACAVHPEGLSWRHAGRPAPCGEEPARPGPLKTS